MVMADAGVVVHILTTGKNIDLKKKQTNRKRDSNTRLLESLMLSDNSLEYLQLVALWIFFGMTMRDFDFILRCYELDGIYSD